MHCHQARQYAVRASLSDAVFVSAVCRLVHQIGIASSSGHQLVTKLKDLWKDLHLTIASAKRLPSSSIGGPSDHHHNSSSSGASSSSADASIDTARFSFD